MDKENIMNAKINIKYGKIGTEKRDKFEEKAQYFVINLTMPVLFLTIVLACPVGFLYAQGQSIDLSGKWQLLLDQEDVGEAQQWYDCRLQHEIQLPGSLASAAYGKKHIAGTDMQGGQPETYGLANNFNYIGAAWYQKKFTVPENWKGKHIHLMLERCMWQTKLWVNGNYSGEGHSLCAPHNFDVSPFLKTGENIITLRIDNSPYVHLGSWSHGYSPGMQTIWNGITGEIKLMARELVCMENVQVYTSWKKQEMEVKGVLLNKSKSKTSGKLRFTVANDRGKPLIVHNEEIALMNGSTVFHVNISLNGMLEKWDEFTPNLYTLGIVSTFDGQVSNELIRFGVRDIEAVNGRFVVNGKKVFMRGEHDGGSFPLTGYPSTDKKDWERIFNIGKEYGLNHWRFHSWCPPKAAFDAADEIGVYLQPELTLFSQDWEGTLVGTDPARDTFLFEELKRLLDTYGNHPSFVLMCMGNELRGNHEVLEKWVTWGKAHDPRHLYAGSANLEAMKKYEILKGDDYQVAHAGKYKGKRVARRMYPYFNNEKPNTQNDYRHTLEPPYDQWPIIAHETGQWTVFPDFREIEKYTGVLKPRNFEIFKSRMEQKGLLQQADSFLLASGKLSALLYREEMERCLRTPGMGGFQLLDLRDYQAQGSAMVGMLNAFWEPKGLISPAEFRQSCNATPLLLQMKKRVWLNNENFDAGLVLPNYSPADIEKITVKWSVYCDDGPSFSGTLAGENLVQGEVNTIGRLSFSLEQFKKAEKLVVKLHCPELKVNNHYDIWVYPADIQPPVGNVIIATGANDELLEKINKGASVLLVPDTGYDAEKMTFTTPFWSTILFNYQIKTMGILCNPGHPVFADFPTDFHTNWQWWELIANASAVRLNQTERSYKPIVQIIDHPVRNDKLGAFVETAIGKGKLFVSTLDILSDLEARPVARQLKASVLNYMGSDAFNPPVVPGIKEAFFDTGKTGAAYVQINSGSGTPEHPALFAFDNNPESYWEFSVSDNEQASLLVQFEKERYITGCLFDIDNKTGPGKFRVFVTNNPENKGEAIISGDTEKSPQFEARSWDNGFTIQKGKKGKFAIFEFETKPEDKININEIEFLFGD